MTSFQAWLRFYTVQSVHVLCLLTSYHHGLVLCNMHGVSWLCMVLEGEESYELFLVFSEVKWERVIFDLTPAADQKTESSR